ncbi:putative LRR receptor-like serine/threonine-protein kinase [Apostasia shenzhenica]|uniref:non-specific serine/threonine protein kinase n=1 Tax=Apostasia shenzhenica TaxID=1088818 RepID=A0A2I0AWE7_9ASPA|nr:putative LRR receptor-like serine/threonine-protein kinase [Apostasia shenzhenica]
MSEKRPGLGSSNELFPRIVLPFLLLLISGAAGESPSASEKNVLLDLKSFLLHNNRFNRGRYAGWNESEPSPCRWAGISCDSDGRVTGIDLRDSNISGEIYSSFSALPALVSLDLSANSLTGPVPPDLNQCRGLRYLNVSHNLINGELNITGLAHLENLDVSVNRFVGRVISSFPLNCGNLISLNISSNNFTGDIDDYFKDCHGKLQFLDLSLNQFGVGMWMGFWWLREFLASDNHLTGELPPETFPASCNLESLDLSGNGLRGSFPHSIANCSKLTFLNIWGNLFTGRIPSSIGSLSELNTLILGNNSFDKNLPVELAHCPKLLFLDLSRNRFGGEVQRNLGNFTTLQFLILHSNSYTVGIEESGVLKLPNLRRLDLSFNNFSRELPIAAADMPNLKFLVLANNDFYGRIPPEYGRITTLQALDLSFNRLSGGIPPELGNLTSLLWLMLGNNKLTGSIPPEIGNCSSLLWLNLANNRLSGRIPPEISKIGRDPTPTFEKNRKNNITAGTGECLAMMRWLPATYPPFNFVYTVMTRRTCRGLWDQLLKGYGIFPVCLNASKPIRTLDSTGYLQLSSNQLFGEIPPEIGEMGRLSILSIGSNQLSGRLPSVLGRLPLLLLNVSSNRFSGPIPVEIGGIQCLQILDLSMNNFSGEFPGSLNRLSDLSKFNVSFNPLLRGVIPISGQIATFDNSSFLGDPLMTVSTSTSTSASPSSKPPPGDSSPSRWSLAKVVSFWIFFSLTVVIFLSGILCFVVCLTTRTPIDPNPVSDLDQSEIILLEGVKLTASGSTSDHSSSPCSGVRVFQLGKTAFTYSDILEATGNFSKDMMIGCGGSGVVYRGLLPDGRSVAVKKLQRGGSEGERAFRAEMEILAGGHPNLVSLFGWCLAGAEKILVYEYMEGGSLEDVIKDRQGFGWVRRVEAAVGVARALAHLHHECLPAVVHRDVKASNVMMDGRGMARVTDFGLARVVVNGETHVSTVVAGTVGYVAPEYGQTWRATTKGDAYSFGVVAMELATGRSAVEDGGEECLVEWARRVGVEGAAAAAVEGWGEGGEAMKGLMTVGMMCTKEVPQDRPDMREVLEMLVSIAGDGVGENGRRPFDCQCQRR